MTLDESFPKKCSMQIVHLPPLPEGASIPWDELSCSTYVYLPDVYPKNDYVKMYREFKKINLYERYKDELSAFRSHSRGLD